MTSRIIIGKSADESTSGLFVSRPGIDVLDPVTARSGNMHFDSSDSSFRTLRVLQRGTFNFTCIKQFFAKKGASEFTSDETNRANTSHVKMYPWELDTVGDGSSITDEMHVFNRRASSDEFSKENFILTSESGAVPNPKNLANVYCDWGTQTIAFDPVIPDHIKTPHVSVSFALANSTGHYHPWYADVSCTPGSEEYEWTYNDSQKCVHMDSAWMRGKWSFRQRLDTGLTEDLLSTSQSIQVEAFSDLQDEITDDDVEMVHILGPDTIGNLTGGVDLGRIKINDGNPYTSATGGTWGGMFKSFTGLQGIAYFANNSHITLDGFLTPTHTPTPFGRSQVHSDLDTTDLFDSSLGGVGYDASTFQLGSSESTGRGRPGPGWDMPGRTPYNMPAGQDMAISGFFWHAFGNYISGQGIGTSKPASPFFTDNPPLTTRVPLEHSVNTYIDMAYCGFTRRGSVADYKYSPIFTTADGQNNPSEPAGYRGLTWDESLWTLNNMPYNRFWAKEGSTWTAPYQPVPGQGFEPSVNWGGVIGVTEDEHANCVWGAGPIGGVNSNRSGTGLDVSETPYEWKNGYQQADLIITYMDESKTSTKVYKEGSISGPELDLQSIVDEYSALNDENEYTLNEKVRPSHRAYTLDQTEVVSGTFWTSETDGTYFYAVPPTIASGETWGSVLRISSVYAEHFEFTRIQNLHWIQMLLGNDEDNPIASGGWDKLGLWANRSGLNIQNWLPNTLGGFMFGGGGVGGGQSGSPGGTNWFVAHAWGHPPMYFGMRVAADWNFYLNEIYQEIAKASIGGNYGPMTQRTDQDRFLETHTLQGQPTGLDSFWNSFSNNTSQFVSSNTPYGEFAYSQSGYAMNFDHVGQPYEGHFAPTTVHHKATEYGGTSKMGIGTEGPRFGFGGAGSVEAIGPGGFDTYIGTYVIYDLEGGNSDV